MAKSEWKHGVDVGGYPDFEKALCSAPQLVFKEKRLKEGAVTSLAAYRERRDMLCTVFLELENTTGRSALDALYHRLENVYVLLLRPPRPSPCSLPFCSARCGPSSLFTTAHSTIQRRTPSGCP